MFLVADSVLSLADDEAAMLGVSVRTARIYNLIHHHGGRTIAVISVTGDIVCGLVARIARMILKKMDFQASASELREHYHTGGHCHRSAGEGRIPISILTSLWECDDDMAPDEAE